MEVGTTFCRFCAEFKPFGKLYNLQSNVSICKEIELKVQFIQADFINLRVEGNYPATVCFVCKEALDQVYIFFKKVKKAQEIVGDLLNNPELFRIASEQSTCIKSESPTDILPEKGIPEIPEEVIPEDDFSEFESFDTKQENDNDDTTSEKSLPKIKKYKRNIKTDDKLKPKSWNHMRWICDHCNDEFSDIQSLRTHSKSTHNICRAFKCPECTTYQGAKSFNGFIRHVRKHYVHLRKFCIHCNKRCATAPRLIFHSQDHLADKSSCGYCGDIFNDAIELQEHLNLYSLRQRNPKRPGEGNDISDRTCKVCHKVFQSTAYIPEHMLIHQGKRRIYTCDRCGKSFNSKGSLVYHLKSYNEEKKFSCKICNKSFSVRSRLVQHIIRHSDVKKFKCEECGKKFKIGRQLKEHRLIHTNYMPFSCEVCAKQFRRKNNLKQHLLQHTGEKPYSCEVCDKTFTDIGNRNKHMKRVHNKDVVKRLEVIEESAGDIEKWKETLTLEKYIRRL